MGWDDFNNYDNDPVFGWDYIDYMNKTGIYEESHDEEDPEGELMMFGLDPYELEGMSEEARREAIEEAGLDPDDYNFITAGNTKSGFSGKSVNTTSNSYSRSTSSVPAKNTSGKWSLVEFTIIVTIIAIIGYAVAAFGGELLGAIVVIIVFIIIGSCF